MSRRSGGARDAPAVRLLHGLAQRQTLRAEEITGLAFADLSDNQSSARAVQDQATARGARTWRESPMNTPFRSFAPRRPDCGRVPTR